MDKEILYGRQPVLETLRARRRTVHRLLLGEGVRSSAPVDDVRRLAEAAGVTVREMSNAALGAFTDGGHHQGVAAEVSVYPYVELDELIAGAGTPAFLLLLDHVQDPQNLGALLRTAEAAGVGGVIIPKDRAVEVTPAVVRASAGASEHMRVSRVVNLVRAMEALREAGMWLAGLEGVPEAKLYTEADLRGPLGLIVGSEGQGLGRLVRERCDYLIRLPLRGQVGSLNASAAGAIALYEALRQRGA